MNGATIKPSLNINSFITSPKSPLSIGNSKNLQSLESNEAKKNNYDSSKPINRNKFASTLIPKRTNKINFNTTLNKSELDNFNSNSADLGGFKNQQKTKHYKKKSLEVNSFKLSEPGEKKQTKGNKPRKLNEKQSLIMNVIQDDFFDLLLPTVKPEQPKNSKINDDGFFDDAVDNEKQKKIPKKRIIKKQKSVETINKKSIVFNSQFFN